MNAASIKTTAAFLLLCACAACADDDDDDNRAAAGQSGSPGSGARGGSGAKDSGAANSTKDAGASDLDPQLPPADSEKVEAWLAAKLYESWRCEDKPTAKTFGAPAIHAHGGKSRVCNNDLLASTDRSGDDEFPKGVASVKELYDNAGKQVGSAVAVKIAAESDDGNGWYWWEGSAGSGIGAKTCTGCHGAAGSDDDHPGAGDYVYFKN